MFGSFTRDRCIMHDDGGRSENNIKCVVHDDLGWKNQTTRYILLCHWLYEWFSQFHSGGTYSVLSRSHSNVWIYWTTCMYATYRYIYVVICLASCSHYASSDESVAFAVSGCRKSDTIRDTRCASTSWMWNWSRGESFLFLFCFPFFTYLRSLSNWLAYY